MVAVSKIEKQSAVQLSKHSVNSFTCLYTCEAFQMFINSGGEIYNNIIYLFRIKKIDIICT